MQCKIGQVYDFVSERFNFKVESAVKIDSESELIKADFRFVTCLAGYCSLANIDVIKHFMYNDKTGEYKISKWLINALIEVKVLQLNTMATWNNMVEMDKMV